MKKVSDILETIRSYLHTNEFREISKISPENFTRDRIWSSQAISLLILNQLKSSIPKELIPFCKYSGIKQTTRSSVTQARAKLSPKVFIKLNDILTREFYTESSSSCFLDFYMMAIDGTTLELPIDAPQILEHYGFASNQTERKIPMARASYLYDVCNGVITDAIIAPYSSDERGLAMRHFEELIKKWPVEKLSKTLIIFDRGYPSITLIVYLLKKGIHFLMRCNKQFIKEVNQFAASDKKDEILAVSLKGQGNFKAELKKLFPDLDLNESIAIRAIAVILNTGEKELLITSLLDQEKWPYSMFKDLYFNRWGVEECYKFHKVELEIENFSGKSCHVIEQDFHATILASNVRALLDVECEQEATALKETSKHITNTQGSQGKESEIDLDEFKLKIEKNDILVQSLAHNRPQTKYVYKINKNISMAALKHELIGILVKKDADVNAFCEQVKKIMRCNRIPIRPGRSNKRKLEHPHRKFHMNLR